ncbi:transposase [Mycobacterium gordonae]|uniref:transposase n=1 Tax=Mycobacterium gordonae TaxID=1778 RepID=UPI003557B89E
MLARSCGSPTPTACGSPPFITDTPPGVVPGQVAGLELRHRQHARVEDRIRELKATGLRNLPCQSFWAKAAWLETTLAAADLVTWCRLIGFRNDPGLARVEITTFRYRVLHVAARITRGALQDAATHRPHLALGHPHRNRLADHPHRLRITASPTAHRSRRTYRPWKARPTRRHGTDRSHHHTNVDDGPNVGQE